MPSLNLSNNFIKYYSKLLAVTIYKFQFKYFGNRSRIENPLKVNGKQYIEIGNRVLIQYRTWLGCFVLTGNANPILKIGSNTTIGNYNHIISTKEVIIEEHVLTADKVYITDNLHGYEDISTPIIKQPIKQINKVVIGEGSWIGENVSIIGASIGKHCVIGANAVVTKNIPDYSVAVGIPAKVIKQYNFETKKWEKITNH